MAIRPVEAVIADDVARKAGARGQPVGVRLLSGSPRRSGGKGISSTSGIWQAADASKISTGLPFSTTSSTSVTRKPALSATASPGSRYTVKPYSLRM